MLKNLLFFIAFPSVTLLFVASCGLCLSPTAIAEADPSSEPDAPVEMVIKGVPFSAPLLTVPQSTTVILGNDLSKQGVSNFADVIETVPGLSFSGGTSRPRFFIIRGIGELEQYEGAPNPSVATIIDDVDVSGLGIVAPLYDIDQIEILRGPQATRFGSSALAGAINVRSAEPTPFVNGRITFGAGNDDLASGGFAVGGSVFPERDHLQLRVTAFSSRSNGFRYNEFLDRHDTNERDESLLRMRVRYIPSTDLTVDFTAWWAELDNGYDAFSIRNGWTTYSDEPGRDETETKATTLKSEYRLSEAIKLVNSIALAQVTQNYSFDGDWGNNPGWGIYAPYDYFSDSHRIRRVVSNELRILSDDSRYRHGESFRWMLGGFGQRLSEGTTTNEFASEVVYDYLQSDYIARQGAVFGQLESPLTRGTSATIGLRVERRTMDYKDSRPSSFSPGNSMIGGAASVEHDLSDSLRAYVLIARGFKGGGMNAGPSVPASRRVYDPEYLWSFESGIKGAWLERKLRTTLAIFQERRRDGQLKLAIQDDPQDPLSFTYITESAARGRSTGIEVEASYEATKMLGFFAGGSVLETSFTDVPLETASLRGRAFSHAPEWHYQVGTRIRPLQELLFRVGVIGKDRFYLDDSHNETSDAYHLTNASLTWARGGWTLSVWTRNLFNEKYSTRGFFFGNEPPDFPNKRYTQQGDPRAYGVTAEYRF